MNRSVVKGATEGVEKREGRSTAGQVDKSAGAREMLIRDFQYYGYTLDEARKQADALLEKHSDHRAEAGHEPERTTRR